MDASTHFTHTTTLSARARRALVHAAAATPVLALSLACLTPVEGDRAATGECPAGETCSEATPVGLTFIGRAFFDQGETPRLGPIVEGGTLAVGLVGLVPEGASDAVAHEARVDDASILSVERGTGTFGPTDEEGVPFFPVDDHVVVTGARVGTASVRVVDPATGELYDRTPLMVVGVDDVRIVSATDPERDHLLAGCDEMVGVQLLSGQSGIEIRAIDDSMTVHADGTEVLPEPMFWDCVQVTPAADAREMRFEVHAGGRDHVRTIEVHTLAEDGLTACPARRD
jgi:hypothetical protein